MQKHERLPLISNPQTEALGGAAGLLAPERTQGVSGGDGRGGRPDAPEELVQVSVLHVLEDHDEGVPVTAHAVELDDVLMLQVGEQLGLPLEVLPGCQRGVLQGLERAWDTGD